MRVPAAQIHLVRHGEVHNPDGVVYGRIPGFGLSERGRRLAAVAAAELVARDRPMKLLVVSPLQRAQESASPIVEAFQLQILTDERVIEPHNVFDGTKVTGKSSVLKRIRSWPKLINPLRPSWGEPYRSIVNRMIAAIDEHQSQIDGGDLIIVSHQCPIWMVHLAISGKSLPHDPRKRRCALSSITTLERRGDRYVEVDYYDPAPVLDAAEASANTADKSSNTGGDSR